MDRLQAQMNIWCPKLLHCLSMPFAFSLTLQGMLNIFWRMFDIMLVFEKKFSI